MRLTLMSAVAGLLVVASHCSAIDFAKVDRRIVKEPAYKEAPLYGLAVIGPEANTRVWMVLDGEKLYVDKNCNGDLTDDGPPAEIKDPKTDPAGFEIVKAQQMRRCRSTVADVAADVAAGPSRYVYRRRCLNRKHIRSACEPSKTYDRYTGKKEFLQHMTPLN